MRLRRFILSLLILAAAVSLGLGLTLPVLKLTRLYVWTDEHSVLSIIWALYQDDELLLAAIIALFSVVFPVLKLVYLLAAAFAEPGERTERSRLLVDLEWLGKWSMLDVLVLALTVFYVKSSHLADAVTLPGVTFFAAAVVLTMLAHGWVKHRMGGA
jgi:paraquat-inducible protein A